MTGPRGAVVTAEGLIATRFAARFIDVTGQTRALANLAGMRRSRQRGRGVEFDEVRAYAAGDDVRAIDWRVTARSGTPHTKLFHEDREQPILVAVDQRSPMKFGASRCFKSVMAAHLGALALWSGLQAPVARVSPKYFYDALGSRLFEAITELDEYYPTRTEAAIFDAHAADIAARLRAHAACGCGC